MSPDDKDKRFWLDVVKEIRPLPQDMVLVRPDVSPIVIHEHLCFPIKQEFSVYSKAFEDSEFSGIDKVTLRKFKQEKFKIEAVLDLHGRREEDAFEQVEDFITRSYGEGKRCVVIVTGKGKTRAQDDLFASRGVLKKQVPQWLNTPRIRAMILIFKNPSEKLGGSGALYILLKRNRET